MFGRPTKFRVQPITGPSGFPAPKMCDPCRAQFFRWAATASPRELKTFFAALGEFRYDHQAGRMQNVGE